VRALWWFGGGLENRDNSKLQCKMFCSVVVFCDSFVVVLWMVWRIAKNLFFGLGYFVAF